MSFGFMCSPSFPTVLFIKASKRCPRASRVSPFGIGHYITECDLFLQRIFAGWEIVIVERCFMSVEDHIGPAARVPLDAIVDLLQDPAFAAQYRRRLSLRETSRHVNPLMLAGASHDSIYVREWSSHARECDACGKLFVYFGLM